MVIYLKPTTSKLAYQTSYNLERTHHEFDVVRLWEQPASLFLEYPGLLPFSQSESPAEMLRQATQLVEQIEEPITQDANRCRTIHETATAQDESF